MSGNSDCDLNFLLNDGVYQVILKASRAIAFIFDLGQKKEFVSPHIGELLAGNYNGRLLSQTMLEDGVIHPSDVEKAIAFRELVLQKKAREMVLRLKTPEGEFRWFRMVMTCQTKTVEKLLCVGLLLDVDERMQYQEELRRQAEYDPVSGVYHRMNFLSRVQAFLEKTRNDSCFLLQFDIDRFKMVNELYGMEEGDKVLRYIGELLKKLARSGEIYGRLRDDVFCVCTNRNREETLAMMNQIHQGVKGYPLAFRFFLPTGIVEIEPDCTDSPTGLCDKAMLAQRSIKGNYLREYCFYEAELGKRLNREHLLISEMEQALNDNQFEVWFQPQYDIRSKRMIGAESLARWRHPELGLISPKEFIPLFERNGFIVELDEYIWEQACRCMSRWLAAGIAPPPISVNVSRVHLYDAEFGDKIGALCRRFHVPPRLLWLEITESAYIQQPQELFRVMKQMKQMGFQFAMDDFGSGYSSLNMLKDIPVDLIKFDLRFLAGANKDGRAGQIILEKSVELIEELGLSCVAEGVETWEQVQLLQSIGCNKVQGYYFSRPMPLEEFQKILNEKKE